MRMSTIVTWPPRGRSAGRCPDRPARPPGAEVLEVEDVLDRRHRIEVPERSAAGSPAGRGRPPRTSRPRARAEWGRRRHGAAGAPGGAAGSPGSPFGGPGRERRPARSGSLVQPPDLGPFLGPDRVVRAVVPRVRAVAAVAAVRLGGLPKLIGRRTTCRRVAVESAHPTPPGLSSRSQAMGLAGDSP